MKLPPAPILLLVFMISFACSKNEIAPNEKTEQLLKSQMWKLKEAKVDEAFTSIYDGLTLSFGSGTYSTTHGAPVWKPAGTWEFKDKEGKIIVRDDGLLITIVSLTGQELILAFVWTTTTLGGGRTGSLSGVHVMKFARE